MWFGTQDGLNRYDGYGFKVFREDPRNPDSISKSFIRCLAEDNMGRLWIGTRDGLNRYDPIQEQFTRFYKNEDETSGPGANEIFALWGDEESLWIGTNGGGLCRFDLVSERFSWFPFGAEGNGELGSGKVKSLTLDQGGRLWVGTDSGLYRSSEQGQEITFQRYEEDGFPRPAHVQVLQADRDGAIWAGTRRYGLYRIEPETNRFSHTPLPGGVPGSGWVTSICADVEGELWVGTSKGLARRVAGIDKSPQFHHYRHDPGRPESLVNNQVRSIFRDRSGALWVGTKTGLDRWHPIHERFSHYRHQAGHPDSLSNDLVHAITEQGPDVLWVGTESGLNRYDTGSGSVTVYGSHEEDLTSLSNKNVTAIRLDQKGLLWVGTKMGLNRYRAQSNNFERLNMEPSDGGFPEVKAFAEDKADQFWIGTFGRGLFRYDRGQNTFTAFVSLPDKPESLSNDFVYSLLADSKGVLWVGTGDGLNSLAATAPASEGLHFKQYAASHMQPEGLSDRVILSLAEDPLGRIWVGTSAGLNCLLGSARFATYNVKDGLANDVINGIVDDGKNGLWLSTNKGLSHFDPDQTRFTNYDVRDWLPGNEYNQGASFRSPRDGRIFFGGVHGLTAFYPEKITPNTKPPPVVITSFEKLGQGRAIPLPHQQDAPIDLSYKDRILSLSFATLDFAIPEKNTYAWRLAGVGQSWIPLGGKHEITLTGLVTGHHHFQVKAANSDGVWNEEGVSLRFFIEPPFWRTPLAFSLYVLLFAAAIFAYYWRLLATNRLLEVKVANRTQELAQKNQEIVQAQEKLVMQEKMASLGTLTEGLAYEINNPNNIAHGGAQLLKVELDKFLIFLKALEGDDGDQPILCEMRDRLDLLEHRTGVVLTGTNRIKAIVQDLMMFTRHNERGKVNFGVVNGLQATVNLLRSNYKDRVDIECVFEANPMLLCEPSRLNQVFMNLITNACQAMDEKRAACTHSYSGKLKISTSLAPPWLKVCFEDNGPGIPAHIRDHIFEPFFTTKEVGQGSGLGLSSAYGIIREHHGRIQVDESEDGGTIFTLFLPLERKE